MEKVTERRFEVWKAKQGGADPGTIAAQLNVAPSIISKDLQWIEAAETFSRMVSAEQPVALCGDPSIDALENQAKSLERGQAAMRPDSEEFLKRSEQIGWLRLKAGTLRQRLPNHGQTQPVKYEFSSVSGQFVVDVAPISPNFDPDLLAEAMRWGRIRAIPCPCNCGKEVFVKLHDLRAFVATQPGWEITHEFIETVTGSGLKQRKEFDAMMLAASQRRFDFLLVWKLDRLTRQGISTTLDCIKQLDTYGVHWRSYMEPFLDTGNEMTNKIVLTVISEMARAERQTLIDRTKAGLRTARRNGKVLGRPRRAIDWVEVNKRVAAGESVRSIGRDLKVSHSLLLKGIEQ